MRTLKLFTDGAARGNPGPAGVGIVILDENDTVIEEQKQFIGHATNNVAEYKALLLGLEHAEKHNPDVLRVYLDSELVCRQMCGVYRVKDENLLQLFQQARALVSGFKKVEFSNIVREKNKMADNLANQAINLENTGIRKVL